MPKPTQYRDDKEVNQVANKKKPVAQVPEVLPAENQPTALQGGLVDARRLQDAVLFHAIGFAASRIAYGLQLIELKQAVKAEGFKWKGWYQDNLARPKFSYRNATEYMDVAKAWQRKVQNPALFGRCGPVALLQSTTSADTQEAHREEFMQAVAAVTSAATWHQIQIDLGLVKPEKDSCPGGYHAPRHLLAEFAKLNDLPTAEYAEWPEPTQAAFRKWRSEREREEAIAPVSPEQMRKEAEDAWNTVLTIFNQNMVDEPTWEWLSELDRRAVVHTLEKVARTIRKSFDKSTK